MTKRDEDREKRWQTVESAVASDGPELYRLLARLSTDPSIADELWVDTFVEVFAEPRKFTKPSLQRRLIYTAAQRLCQARGFALPDAPSPDKSGEPQGAGTPDGVQTSVERPEGAGAGVLNDELRSKLHKRLMAEEARMDALQRRRGPQWTSYAVGLTAAAGIAAVTYGLVQAPVHVVNPVQTTRETNLAAKFPPPLTNLPTTTEAQFEVPDTSAQPTLRHVAVTSSALYIPSMQFDKSGQRVIAIQRLPFSATGETWTAAAQTTGSLPLSPPVNVSTSKSTSNSTSTPSSWHVVSWQFNVSQSTAVAVVNWQAGGSGSGPSVTQIYGYNLQKHTGGLLKTLQPRPGEATAYVAAAGDGRVVVQPGISENTGNSTTMVGLPIQVYQLNHQAAAPALSSQTQVPGSFGFMESPTLIQEGLVFQGIQGQANNASAIDATWYMLNWDGTLNKVQGPPLDNQPHWAVQSTTGQLWWAETTPDVNGQSGAVQVVMGPLSAANQAASPSQTLSGPVTAFTVSGNYVVWEQTNDGFSQIVVSEVTS